MKNKTAIILCGGKGERLRPITESIPKPLVCINKKPILEYIINYLSSYHFDNVILATGYKSNKIQDFQSKISTDIDVRCFDTGDVDIVKRLEIITKDLDTDIFLLYGDTIANVDFNLLESHHNKHNYPVTITRYPLTTKFGIIDSDKNGKVTKFLEKPTLDIWYNIGYIFIEKKIFKKFSNFDTFVELLNNLVETGELNSFNHTGHHITVNTLEELNYAEKNINKIIIKK